MFAFAAVWHDERQPILAGAKGLAQALDQLEARLAEARHCLGHNIIRHDLPHIAANRPHLSALAEAPIDTLWLNPLAFPENPYHHLVKHHLDGRLQAGHINDPAKDARLVFELFEDQLGALGRLNEKNPETVLAYHYLTTRLEKSDGFDAVFTSTRGEPPPSQDQAKAAVQKILDRQACRGAIDILVDTISSPRNGWPTAYAVSWVTVAGGNSVMPPWVRAQFPEASDIVKSLRDTDCRSPDCEWCRKMNDPREALRRWFGFEGFRKKPADKDGRPLQERIVEEAMLGESILGILPTGTGKSVCYQIPALSKFEKVGALSVVISPLVALMNDQVQGMVRQGISSAVTVNGMLSLPERQHVLDQVRLGDASILLISPEQLRSVGVRSVLKQRDVGLWVLDEAHCVSKWGHDFRPDYRYIGRFIKEFSGDRDPAPVLCLTATAKPEVVADIKAHFQEKLQFDLQLLDGGAVRTNLEFEVRSTKPSTKLSDILEVIQAKLPAEGASGAVIYCSSRKQTETVADFLKQQKIEADFFHAGLTPDQKKEVQERFRVGELRVIAATNAFGMGIDKPDIRLVVHGDIPGSLENYLQEAGRAGRDREHASCVLLFSEDDVERQFTLSARSRLARHEIGAILKALRRLDDKTTKSGNVVATSGEIVRAEQDHEFERDRLTDDTRVKTAVAWLEEGKLLAREENRVQVFPSSLSVKTLAEAKEILDKTDLSLKRRNELIAIVRHLMNAEPDEGISTDELTGASGLSNGALPKAMHDLETLGIAKNDLALTVFVHVGVERQSTERLERAAELEAALIAVLQEAEPDAEGEGAFPLQLSQVCQKLHDEGFEKARPDIIERMLVGLSHDGRDQDGGKGNLHIRKFSRDTLFIKLQRTWDVTARSARIRRDGAANLLQHLVGKVPKGRRGKDLQVETTAGELMSTLTGDAYLKFDVKNFVKLFNRSLMWLHEQEILVLGKGLSVFRPAMTIHLAPSGGKFTQQHFTPLEEHYREQTIQTHVMAAYAHKGLLSMHKAMRLSEDYFVLDQEKFLDRWLPGERTAIRRQTTPTSWQAIVDDLNNPIQQKIVSDDREKTNVLVLAGPGSGKTRTLVHRIAYLVRVRREDPNGILVLSYNRHAVTEIRSRLRQLIGEDAHGITVSTCHALAMRLVGTSFVGASADSFDFDNVIREAVTQLQGEGLSKREAEAQREALMQGYRWILVDEYQDIGPEEYDLISAVAGRSQEDTDQKLSLFAVGDDDQNIYAFGGASVDFIRRFEAEYDAKPSYLIENYRSTPNIIAAANSVIAPAVQRMKIGHDITVDRQRVRGPKGGAMQTIDPVAHGRVQILKTAGGDIANAIAAVDELVRISDLDPDWDWSKTAIIARNWKQLEPVRSYAEKLGIPVELANENLPSIWRLRETQALVEACRRHPDSLLTASEIEGFLHDLPASRWSDLLAKGIADLRREIGQSRIAFPDLLEWIAEWCRDARIQQHGVLLMTAHRAKGLEFNDVVILDGDWQGLSKGEDPDAPRRLFYVAMTRAKRSLAVLTDGSHPYLRHEREEVLVRDVAQNPQTQLIDQHRYDPPNMELVDLSYAGRLYSGNNALQAIKAARIGDPVKLSRGEKAWMIHNAAGQVIGRMAYSFHPPKGWKVEKATVGAIIQWRKSDNQEEYREYIKREQWETILPDITYAPA
ncbi:RecQ family ATP-dependent DNA helicase [Qipengyuania sp. 1NDW9]|uniref:RecQ family ATP-dependent DNA helicase n=1 Tax=Qipengyuania xiapuensis TaxID=2867236 RepID=UPI001C870932|nr:RecQ family ATP-dependent DNA helicase [Qipengyuania xiapuensis]